MNGTTYKQTALRVPIVECHLSIYNTSHQYSSRKDWKSNNVILLAVFQVDNDGIIRTTGELDREQQSLYRITVTAEDMGVPVRSQSANVIITINDVNDNSPVFVEGVTETSEVYEVIFYMQVPIL